MGYRGTREQLEARWAALPKELEAMHEELSAASSRVEHVRRSEWGALGVWWFYFTLRRALRDVDTPARWDGRSSRGLVRAVKQHERALAQGRAVIRWLEESIAPKPADPPAEESARAQPPSAIGEWVRSVLAVIGAGARASWIVARPVLMVLGLVALIGVFMAQDADADPPDVDFDWESPETGFETPAQRRDGDVSAGLWTISVLGLLAASGGALAWWLG